MSHVLDDVQETFRAVATTVVPEVGALDASTWREVRDVVEATLAERPADMQRQLVTFLRVIEYLPLARYGTRFTNLRADRRASVLHGLQESRIALLRRGMWGLRTLIFMGYYTRVDVSRAIGYRASREGWSARRGAVPSAAPPSAAP